MRTTLFLAGAVAIAAAVSSCTPPNIPAPQTPAQSVYVVESEYLGLAIAATNYTSLPRCVTGGPKLCSDQATVDKIRTAAAQAWAAIQAAQAAVRATPTGTAADTAVTQAESAAAALAALLTNIQASTT